MIQIEFNTGSADIQKSIPEELHMEKFVCLWVSHDLTEQLKTEHASQKRNPKII